MRVALITGGTQGIGQAIVEKFLTAGYFVVTCGRRTDFIHSYPPETFLYIPCDIAQKEPRNELIKTVITKLGHIDVLINNAGVAPRERKDLLEATEEAYEWLMKINLQGPYFLTQSVAKEMIKLLKSKAISGYHPCIINISSISAWTSSTNRGEYCISKAGLAMMTQLYADRLAEYGILVYEIQPGIIATPMTEPVKEKYDKLIQEGILPIKRWGQPQDIADTALTLAEGKIPYSTGQVLHIDGGFHIRRL
jgi:3-oxoacyl-[acyl-carrier protein] reductase